MRGFSFALLFWAGQLPAQSFPSVADGAAHSTAHGASAVWRPASSRFAAVRQQGSPAAPTPRPMVQDPADQAIEYSDWYERRLTIHRWASYAILPLFAFQYAAGRELFAKSSDAPAWAKSGHGIAATGVAALFGTNTVTGVWNLWDSRKDPEGRARRTIHAVLMLAADAGFAATGLLAERAERSPDTRRLHRTIALTSVGTATIGYLTMLPPFRRD
jgi:hypothetical protein